MNNRLSGDDLGAATALDLSVVVINFNGMGTLPTTLDALAAYNFPFAEIIVVDDGSEDASLGYVRAHHPQVTLLDLGRNTRNTSLVRNSGLKRVNTPYVLLLDNDITPLPGSIETLLEHCRDNPNTLAATPRLLFDDKPEIIYSDGGSLHFLALGAPSPRGRNVADQPAGPARPTCGCGIMLINMGLARTVGWFNENYEFGWGDDGEFHLRGRLFGYDVMHLSTAAMLHHGKDHGFNRAGSQLHNRYRLILTFYSTKTLLTLAPSLLLFEFALIAMALLKGFSREWLRAIGRIWHERAELKQTRHLLQQRRVRKDSELLQGGLFETPGPFKRKGAMAHVTLWASKVANVNWLLLLTFF